MTSCIYQSHSPKNVYFLGAGASVSAGVPTFSNFREKAEKIYSGLNKDDPKKEIFENVLKDWNEHFKDYDIERYFAVIEMHEKLKHNYNIKPENIIAVISSTIQKSMTKNDIFAKNSQYSCYNKFVGNIKTRKNIQTNRRCCYYN